MSENNELDPANTESPDNESETIKVEEDDDTKNEQIRDSDNKTKENTNIPNNYSESISKEDNSNNHSLNKSVTPNIVIVDNTSENHSPSKFNDQQISIDSLINSPKGKNKLGNSPDNSNSKTGSPRNTSKGNNDYENKPFVMKEEIIKVHKANHSSLLLCYLCGGDFDKLEIEQHVLKCIIKYEHIKEKIENNTSEKINMPDIYKELFNNMKNETYKINYKEFNSQVEKLSSNFAKVACPLCNKQFQENRIEIHYNICKAKYDIGISPRKASIKDLPANFTKDGLAYEKTQSQSHNTNNLTKSFNFNKEKDSKLIFLQNLEKQVITSNLICYICGVEQILAEFSTHVESCEVNFAKMQQNMNEEDRRKLPLKPDILNEILAIPPDDPTIESKIQEYNKLADATNHKDLFFEECTICGRKLLIDRMEVHSRVCKKKDDFNKTTRNTAVLSKKSTLVEGKEKDNKLIKDIKVEYNSKSPLPLKKKNLLYSSQKLESEKLGTKPSTSKTGASNVGSSTLTTNISKINKFGNTSNKNSLLSSTSSGFNKKTTISTDKPIKSNKNSADLTFTQKNPKVAVKATENNLHASVVGTTSNTPIPNSPLLFICFICNNEYQQDVFKAHVFECFNKYNEQIKLNELKAEENADNMGGNIDKLLELSSKCISSIPSEFTQISFLIDSGVKISQEEISNYNEVASKILKEYILKECKFCKRRFMPDRIDLHQNSCKNPNTAGSSLKKTITIKKKDSSTKCAQCNTILLPSVKLEEHMKFCISKKIKEPTISSPNKLLPTKTQSVEKKTLLFKGTNKAKEETKESKDIKDIKDNKEIKDIKLNKATDSKSSSVVFKSKAVEDISKNYNSKKVSTLSKIKDERDTKEKAATATAPLGKDGLAKCDNCKRTFLPDRLVVHQRSCKKNK